jgi:predicted ATP-grasp superfamily ATP-dependent carboligase
MNVLVLDGNQNQAVASVRSLASAGHTVFAAEAASWSKAGWSRASGGTVRYVSPMQNVGAFLESITAFVRQHPGILLLPMTEATTLPLSANRESLMAAGARFVLPEHENILCAFDKDKTTRLASTLGIPIPMTILITNSEQALDVSQSVQYPVVLKPRASEELRAGTLQAGGRPRYAGDSAEFDDAYLNISKRSSAVMVQQYIPGEGAGYFALMHHGELRAEFAHRRIRDVHPTGSGSALRVSADPDPEIRRASLTILSKLNWHGVAMVEWRVRPGYPPVFMEVNGRFWHSLPLACYAGVDFPALLARMAEHGDIEPTFGYRRGVRCRWLLGDARHLVEVWKGPPRGYPGKYPERLHTLVDVLTPVPGTYHDLFQWKDPLPELGDWVHAFSRIVKGR